jgi:hypothetical protein
MLIASGFLGQGNPSFIAVKFEPASKNFNNGASEVFSIVVSNFNPSTTIKLKLTPATARALSASSRDKQIVRLQPFLLNRLKT